MNSQKHFEVGLPPGSLVFTGNQKMEKVELHQLRYNADSFQEEHLDNHALTILPTVKTGQVNWLDVRGIHDTNLITSLGQFFELHPLILEDIVDTQQRPKFEEYEKGIFLLLKAFTFDIQQKKIVPEQIGIYFRTDLVISFQEDGTDIFSAVRQRLKNSKGKIRLRGADYLAYALVDNVVDSYYVLLNHLEEAVEDLEEAILKHPTKEIKSAIHLLKKEITHLRKLVMPLREAINQFSKSESELIKESSHFFIRDLYDHIIQAMDNIDTYREILNGLQDLYVSEISFKMNQGMQLLTIITTIFVPLSFLAGLYGMNFVYMPELQYTNGYFILLGVMTLIAVGFILWFKRKRWL